MDLYYMKKCLHLGLIIGPWVALFVLQLRLQQQEMKVNLTMIVQPLELPPMYIITPTFPRPVQIAELTRLGYVFKNVENMIWIVAEDAVEPTYQVIELLQDLQMPHQYLLTPLPEEYKQLRLYPKGVINRNTALKWIFDQVKASGDDSGVIYFADDDNVYDVRLFDEIRYTKNVSRFPVGFLSSSFVESPVLDEHGKFQRVHAAWHGGRKFIADMAGFAVSVRHFVDKAEKFYAANNQAIMAYRSGYEEDTFLQAMQVPMANMEFMAKNCTKIYAWHTKTVNPTISKGPEIKEIEHQNTNLGELNKYFCLYTGQHRCGT